MKNDKLIIDSHTHILPEVFRRDKKRFLDRDLTFKEMFASEKARTVSSKELLEEMKISGVGTSVACGYGWTDLETAKISNDYILDAAKQFSEKIIPFCSVNPLWGTAAIDEVERCIEKGAKGIGEIHPDKQGLLNADFPTMGKFMDAVSSHNLPILMHTSEPVGHIYPGKGTVTPEFSLAFAEAFPSNKLIFAHFGGGLPFYSLMPEVKKSLGNVWFDTAASPLLYTSNIFKVTADSAGTDRVLFGSDFPLMPQALPLTQIKQASLNNDVLKLILGQNAKCALQL